MDQRWKAIRKNQSRKETTLLETENTITPNIGEEPVKINNDSTEMDNMEQQTEPTTTLPIDVIMEEISTTVSVRMEETTRVQNKDDL